MPQPPSAAEAVANAADVSINITALSANVGLASAQMVAILPSSAAAAVKSVHPASRVPSVPPPFATVASASSLAATLPSKNATVRRGKRSAPPVPEVASVLRISAGEASAPMAPLIPFVVAAFAMSVRPVLTTRSAPLLIATP